MDNYLTKEMVSKIDTPIHNKWISVLVGLIILLVVTFIHISLYEYAFDDAYIHFRVARNFVETGFPHYNTAEIIKVSTNTAWMLVLTLIYFVLDLLGLQESLPIVVSIFNSLVTCSCVFVFTLIVGNTVERRLLNSEKIIFGLSFFGLLLPSSIGLMETPLSLLVFGIALLLVKNQKSFGAILLGWSVYLRLELAIPSLIFLIIYHKQFKIRDFLIWALIGFIPILIFDLFYYGTVIPQSVVAKPIVYDLRWEQTFSQIIFNSIPPVYLFNNAILNSIILIVLIVLILYILIDKKCVNLDGPLFFISWGIGIILFYLIGKAFVFEWYQALYMVPLLISGFILFEKTKVKVLKIHMLALVIILALGQVPTMLASLGQNQMYYYFVGGSRVKTYLEVAKILYREYPEARLMTSEIGGLGYFFRGEIIDAAGLATDEAIDYHPLLVPQERSVEGIGAIPPKFVCVIMPELIVSYDHFMEALSADGVLSQYTEITIPAFLKEDGFYSQDKLIWGSKFLRVLVRNDLLISRQFINNLDDL